MTGLPVARGWMARARTEVAGPRDAWLVVRLCAWCCALRLLKYAVPLPRLVALMRQKPTGASRQLREEQRVVTLARWACRATQWSPVGQCLERALLTYRYLTAMNASPTLVVGIVPGERMINGSRGHAWVTVDGAPVDDTADSLEGFVTVVAFGPDGHPIAG